MPRAGRIEPTTGQESVWDYPRPPSLQASERHIVLVLGGVEIVDTRRSWRVCETSHPPTYYLDPADFEPGTLSAGAGSSHCEFKGAATYWDLTAGGVRRDSAGWSYEDPATAFVPMRGAIAVYPGRMDGAWVDGEPVTAQAGGFYGGWITPDVVGPFKGEPNTWSW